MTEPDPNQPNRPTTNRRLAAGAALAIALLLLAPSGVAYHLSVGAEDTLLVGPSEPPASVSDATYERGIATDCGSEDPENHETLLSDGFCGQLIYNEASTYETLSPPDQVGQQNLQVDLQMTTYVGAYGTATCSPWCNSESTYKALHDVGQSLGLLDKGGDQAWQDDGGTQAYAGNVYAIGPMQAYQAAGQSWLLPVTDTSFVAFVTDGAGNHIGPNKLDQEVTQAKASGALSDRAQSKVCIFTPNAHLGTHAPSAGACEVTLDWMGDDQSAEPCKSDTYVCGSVQPAWRGTTMCPMWHAACYISDAWNSAHHFAVWHAVVAPSPPDGCGAAEPGFDTRDDTFLAHDLDVYEPPTDETPAKGVPHYWDAAARNVPGLGPLRDGRAPNVADTPVGQQVQATPAFTQHEAEPNSQPWLGIEESSHDIQETRKISQCQRLASGEQQADPWVNVVDTHVTRDVQGFGVVAGNEPEPDHEPRPVLTISGHVGLFTDVDDDGDYEQAPASGTLEDIREFGAYPILWDHHRRGEGCTLRDGTSIGTLAQDAGYRDPTGLAVVLRMTAGTLVHEETGQTVPIAQPSAVALLSQNLDTEDPEVHDALQKAAGSRDLVVLQDAFGPQCQEPTGGYDAKWTAVTEPMEGDGVVTVAFATVTDVDGDGEGPGSPGTLVPLSPVDLVSQTPHVWWDVDPFEG